MLPLFHELRRTYWTSRCDECCGRDIASLSQSQPISDITRGSPPRSIMGRSAPSNWYCGLIHPSIYCRSLYLDLYLRISIERDRDPSLCIIVEVYTDHQPDGKTGARSNTETVWVLGSEVRWTGQISFYV